MSDASFCLGVRIYVRSAMLVQQPRALMVEASTPACVATVAVPIIKVCPAYKDWSRRNYCNMH